MQVVVTGVVLVLAVVGSLRSAEATTCSYNFGFPSFELPVGCDLEVYVLDDDGITTTPPDGVAALREPAVDVTASVATAQVLVDVHHFLLGCDGTITNDMFNATRYNRVTFTLAGISPGDVLAPFEGDVSNAWTGQPVTVVGAGMCPTTPPRFDCTSTFPGVCEEPDPTDTRDGGCSTDNSGSLAGLAFIVWWVARRKR